MLPNSTLIRVPKKAEIEQIKEISDANRDSLGFVPRAKILEVIENKRIYIAVDKQTLLGFVVFRHRKIDDQTTLSEICVKKSERGKGIGQALYKHLINECYELERSFLQLKCPIDLPANGFYEKMGCSLHNVEKGKKRPLHVWRYYFSQIGE